MNKAGLLQKPHATQGHVRGTFGPPLHSAWLRKAGGFAKGPAAPKCRGLCKMPCSTQMQPQPLPMPLCNAPHTKHSWGQHIFQARPGAG